MNFQQPRPKRSPDSTLKMEIDPFLRNLYLLTPDSTG
jgi:hypothetical protein